MIIMIANSVFGAIQFPSWYNRSDRKGPLAGPFLLLGPRKTIGEGPFGYSIQQFFREMTTIKGSPDYTEM